MEKFVRIPCGKKFFKKISSEFFSGNVSKKFSVRRDFSYAGCPPTHFCRPLASY
jgi:hypothetical protein